jgi:hypothetical protein
MEMKCDSDWSVISLKAREVREKGFLSFPSPTFLLSIPTDPQNKNHLGRH